eukprot:7147087-Ditylum_brightwellii.AAC.1
MDYVKNGAKCNSQYTYRNRFAWNESNAQSVDTMLGGGANGHLGLVCDSAMYTGIPGAAAYVCPLNPGQLTVTSTAT